MVHHLIPHSDVGVHPERNNARQPREPRQRECRRRNRRKSLEGRRRCPRALLLPWGGSGRVHAAAGEVSFFIIIYLEVPLLYTMPCHANPADN